MVKELAIMESDIDPRFVKQQLDDTCACGLESEGHIQRFTKDYRKISEKVGVSLADLSDEEKAFDLVRSGVVLGLMYDLPRWRVGIPSDKRARFLRTLIFTWQERGCSKKTLRQLCGKVEHYSILDPDSR